MGACNSFFSYHFTGKDVFFRDTLYRFTDFKYENMRLAFQSKTAVIIQSKGGIFATLLNNEILEYLYVYIKMFIMYVYNILHLRVHVTAAHTVCTCAVSTYFLVLDLFPHTLQGNGWTTIVSKY